MTIRLEGVEKVFPDGTAAVRKLDLEVTEGEFLVLVGPSGSGKSTLLRMVAGLEAPTSGRILIDERDVTETEPQERDVAMVFQSYALYPHKTVRENLGFGLRARGRPREEIRIQVERVAASLGIGGLLDRRPAQLSGGQRQRVALGRAIVRKPRAFLLDEPLSNLDPELRHRTRTELARLHRRLAVTTLYVTHDQEEAMTLGGRVAVLRDGRLEQVARPMELYRNPATRFVATFIGSPAMNLLRCRVDRRTRSLTLIDLGVRLPLSEGDLHAPDRLPDEVIVGIRPQDLRPAGTIDNAHLTGAVELVEPRGSDMVLRIGFPAGKAEATHEGREAGISIVVPTDTSVEEGAPFGVRVPTDRLHFFDPHSGARLR